ncbi:MAG TPA: glycosyltransferase 87 family protein, partial [Thermoanaerobaculia bacterium]|nr:glycosyltransferase 87 family protein [Thermoanaerobaculia bacterium]
MTFNARQWWSERGMFLAALVAGSVLRILQIATSVGSSDSFWWTRHVQYVERFGVLRSYLVSPLINHPPFSLAIARLTSHVGAQFGLKFYDAFRGLQSIADVVTMFALARAARKLGAQSHFIPIVFFLSPAAIFISAFHCNSDPTMTMFIVLAMLALIERQPLIAGVLLGAATGIKIIALAALPLMLLASKGWRERVRFTTGAAVTGAAIFLPAVLVTGPVVLKNIFGYTGWKAGWGLPLLLRIAGLLIPNLFHGDPARFVTPLLIIAVFAVWIAELRRGTIEDERLPRVICLIYLIVLFLGSGFGPHYFFWFLPFLAFLFARRGTLILHALVSLFLFFVYTTWSGG